MIFKMENVWVTFFKTIWILQQILLLFAILPKFEGTSLQEKEKKTDYGI